MSHKTESDRSTNISVQCFPQDIHFLSGEEEGPLQQHLDYVKPRFFQDQRPARETLSPSVALCNCKGTVLQGQIATDGFL